MKIIAMTVCCVDIYPETIQYCVGGNSVNFATQCIRSGVKDVSVLGAVGTDNFGKMVIDHLISQEIDVSHVYKVEGVTASNRIYIKNGERTFLPDSWNGGVYEKFHLSESDWSFVKTFDIAAIPANNPNFTETLKQLSGKMEIVVDFLDSRDVNRIKNILPDINLAFVSGNQTMIDCIKEFSSHVNTPIIITLGAEGSVALINGEAFFQESITVGKVIDTTGCGDAYQAAFTVSWYKDRDIKAAMNCGAIAASKILLSFGGV